MIAPTATERAERILWSVQCAGADWMIALQAAQDWPDLALVLADLEQAIEYLSAIRDSGLEKEKGLAQP